MADKYEDEILEGEVSDDDDQEENKKEPEKYCTLCHRAESQVGKMIDLPNNILYVRTVCREALTV